jgi:diguanylate cyclase (GGDEF)-like protein
VMMDIDHFKSLNDTHGHVAGDLALRAVGELVRRACRVSDVAVRYGGEELLVVLPSTDCPAGCVVAERIRDHIAQTTFRFDHREVTVTASFGVATFTDSVFVTDAPTELLKAADAALYRAKAAGRNRVCVEDAELAPAEKDVRAHAA